MFMSNNTSDMIKMVRDEAECYLNWFKSAIDP